VCATAGIDEPFDDWRLDVLLTGAQKAFGAPPGVAILLVSQRALETRRNRAAVPAYNADWLRWLPIMDDPSKYFSTPPVNQIRALNEAMGLVLEEGLEARFARHRELAASIREGLAALDLELFTDAACRADTLSVVLHREGVDDGSFRAAMAAEGVVVAGALGPIAGKAFRVGHMGNIGESEVNRTLEAMRAALGDA
jgi:aspartate aminotransferase-like enzyme